MSKKKPRSVPSWDDYFMMLCFFVASRSKDPSTQVGAVVVDLRHRIRSTGYNGLPAAIPDADIDWGRPNKYGYVVHAEENALDCCPVPPHQSDGLAVYVSGPPCSKCVRRIVSNGIRRIVYGPQPIACVDEEDWALTKSIVALAKADLVRYAGNLNWIRDRMVWMESAMPELFRPQTAVPLAQ